MPAADHFAGLHHAFTQRKSKMWTEILDGINGVVPAKERDIEPAGFHGVAQAFCRKLREAGDPYPFVVHALMLYFRRRSEI